MKVSSEMCVMSGHLLVNLGFGFSDFRFSKYVVCNTFLENLVVKYRGKLIKVFWIDPGQNGGF